MKKYVAGPMDKKSSAGFWGRDMDSRDLAAQRQFLEQLNLAVAIANREVIHKHIPNLNKETFQQLAVMVAKSRAEYLDAAIKLANSPGACDGDCLADLKRKREVYDEGRAAFEALERAIERGYVDIGK
ncbi:MAG: hypothetical protein JO128_14905 [Alphaproteobacteria bacterium]|nr:hypothetical protein [Alphaproteobacteria bacterium]